MIDAKGNKMREESPLVYEKCEIDGFLFITCNMIFKHYMY